MTETINQFGKNIALNCGFDLGAKSLLDSRSIVKDAAELDAIPDIRRANGLLVWIQDEKKLVAWDEPGQAWVEVSGDKFDSTEIEAKIEENTTNITANTAEIADIKKQLGELDPTCTFDNTADHIIDGDHGGLVNGTNIRGWKLSKILDWILFPAQLPKLIPSNEIFLKAAPVFFVDNLNRNRIYGISYKKGDIGIVGNKMMVTTKVNGVVNVRQEVELGDEGTMSLDISTLDGYDEAAWRKAGRHEVTVSATCETVDDETEKAFLLSDVTISSALACDWQFPVYVGNGLRPEDARRRVTIGSYMAGRAVVPLNSSPSYGSGRYNIKAFSDKVMVIVSPYKATKILNPSLFDITQSFTENVVTLTGEPSEETSRYLVVPKNLKVYVYVSEKSTQLNDYPLTITFDTAAGYTYAEDTEAAADTTATEE